MALELIDEQYGLWACSTADLSPEKQKEIVRSWKDGEGMESTIVFCDNCGRIVINRDKINLSITKVVIRLYLCLMAADEQRKQIRMDAQAESIHTKELIEVVYHATLERYALKMEPILKLQDFSDVDRVRAVLRRMAQGENISLYACVNAYNLGRIEGVRAERARHHRRNALPGE